MTTAIHNNLPTLFQPVVSPFSDRFRSIAMEALPIISLISPQAGIIGTAVGIVIHKLDVNSKTSLLFNATVAFAYGFAPLLCSRIAHIASAAFNLIATFQHLLKFQFYNAGVSLLKSGYDCTHIAVLAVANPQVAAICYVATTIYSICRAYQWNKSECRAESALNLASAAISGYKAYTVRSDLFVTLDTYREALKQVTDSLTAQATFAVSKLRGGIKDLFKAVHYNDIEELDIDMDLYSFDDVIQSAKQRLAVLENTDYYLNEVECAMQCFVARMVLEALKPEMPAAKFAQLKAVTQKIIANLHAHVQEGVIYEYSSDWQSE